MIARIDAAVHSPDRLKRLFDFIFAQLFFRLPDEIRRRLYVGEAFYCPVCQCHLRQFISLHRPYHKFCPVCHSLQRHRFIWVFFTHFRQLLHQPIRLLHIAPEPGLAQRFSALPEVDYLSADRYNPAAMVKMDICDIHYPEASFDLIYCSHVLEHVEDDLQALREFFRILKPGGQAIILVPLIAKFSFENVNVKNPVERQRLFGQHDHIRAYGPDFIDRPAGVGFLVKVLAPEDFLNQADIIRMGIEPTEKIFICQKNKTFPSESSGY